MATDSQQALARDAQLRTSIDRSLRHPVMFFFTSGAAWLAVSLVLGIISTIKQFSPDFLGDCGFMTFGRVNAAHLNVLVYGWAMQAAFGVLIWLMARLSRKECTNSGTILAAGHFWNFTVALGTIGIFSGYGTGKMLMEMPTFTWPVLLITYLVIVIGSLVQFRVRSGGHVYISQWYILAAIILFPWFFITSNVLVHVFDGSPLMAAGVNAWFQSAIIYLFLAPVAMASAYYLSAKVSGRPIHSYQLAILGFWALLFVAPWAGMQKLMGAPIPSFLPSLGAAATVLLMFPAIAVGANILLTVKNHGDTVAKSPSLRFTVAGIVGLLLLGVLNVISNTGFGLRLTQFSIANYGIFIVALYGFFSFCMFGAIYFIVPRITGREWLSRRFIRWHFWMSIYGSVCIAICGVFGGFMQGQGQENFQSPFSDAVLYATPYMLGIMISWCFVLFSNVFFFLHLLLMWLRLGRRSAHPTLLGSHHSENPHGPEGEIDNTGIIKA